MPGLQFFNTHTHIKDMRVRAKHRAVDEQVKVCFSVEKPGVKFVGLSNLVRLFVVLLRNVLSVLITISTVIHKALFTLLVVKSAENSMWAAL